MYIGIARDQSHHSEVYPLRSGFVESVKCYKEGQGPDLKQDGCQHPTVYHFAQVCGEQKQQETKDIGG